MVNDIEMVGEDRGNGMVKSRKMNIYTLDSEIFRAIKSIPNERNVFERFPRSELCGKYKGTQYIEVQKYDAHKY